MFLERKARARNVLFSARNEKRRTLRKSNLQQDSIKRPHFTKPELSLVITPRVFKQAMHLSTSQFFLPV